MLNKENIQKYFELVNDDFPHYIPKSKYLIMLQHHDVPHMITNLYFINNKFINITTKERHSIYTSQFLINEDTVIDIYQKLSQV